MRFPFLFFPENINYFPIEAGNKTINTEIKGFKSKSNSNLKLMKKGIICQLNLREIKKN